MENEKKNGKCSLDFFFRSENQYPLEWKNCNALFLLNEPLLKHK